MDVLGVNLATCDNWKGGTRKEKTGVGCRYYRGKEKAPRGFLGACGGFLGQLPARADRMRSKVKRRQSPRYPMTRSRGFISELLNDHAAVKRNDLGMLAEPLKGLKFAVGIVPADFIETVGFGGLKRGRVLRPFAANPDGIEFNLGVGVFLESFEVLEKSAAGGNGELRFAATSAE